MALQVLIELVLGNVGKHFIVGLVCRAVGNPERHNEGSELRGEAPNPPGGCQQEPAQLRGHAGGTGMSPGLGTTSQSGGADARGWAVREARVRSTGTTRRGGRERREEGRVCFTLWERTGRRRERFQQSSTSQVPCLQKRDSLRRFSLEGKEGERSCSQPRSSSSGSEQGEKLMQGCPGKAEVQALGAAVCTGCCETPELRECGREAQPPH